MTLQTIIAITLFNYVYKFVVAILITPLIYAAHWAIDAYLGKDASEDLIMAATEDDIAL